MMCVKITDLFPILLNQTPSPGSTWCHVYRLPDLLWSSARPSASTQLSVSMPTVGLVFNSRLRALFHLAANHSTLSLRLPACDFFSLHSAATSMSSRLCANSVESGSSDGLLSDRRTKLFHVSMRMTAASWTRVARIACLALDCCACKHLRASNIDREQKYPLVGACAHVDNVNANSWQFAISGFKDRVSESLASDAMHMLLRCFRASHESMANVGGKTTGTTSCSSHDNENMHTGFATLRVRSIHSLFFVPKTRSPQLDVKAWLDLMLMAHSSADVAIRRAPRAAPAVPNVDLHNPPLKSAYIKKSEGPPRKSDHHPNHPLTASTRSRGVSTTSDVLPNHATDRNGT